MADLTPRTPTTSFSNTTTTSCTLNVPAGTQEDDLLIAVVAIQNATTLTDHVGWNTQELHGATALSWGIYWRWATSSEPSSYAFTHASARDAGIMVAIPGVDPTTPILAENTKDQGTGNQAFGAIDPGSVEAVVYAFLMGLEAAPETFEVASTNCDSIVGQVSSANASGGQNVGVAILQEYLASGGSFTPTYTITTGTLTRSGTIAIAVKPAEEGGEEPVDLTPADSAHGHTTESPTLTQTHVIAPSGSEHAHGTESPTLTQNHVLAPADSLHGHVSESPTVTVVVDLGSPDDSAHQHTTESPTFAQVHVLEPADSAHGHTTESPALTQLHILAPADSAHGHAAESPTLTQVHVLEPDDSEHTHAAESPTLTLAGDLVADDSVHTHTTESPTLTQLHILEPNDSAHQHTTESPTFVQVHVLAPVDSMHAHAVESPALTQLHILEPVDSLHAHTAESPSFLSIDPDADTPPERTLTIAAEDRRAVFTDDARASSSPTDNRTTSIPAESRKDAIT